MYEFKIGDEVEVIRETAYSKGMRFVVTHIHTNGCADETLVYGADNSGWFPSSLKLVCPAGYRPVREDEMDESPRKGDSWWSTHGNDLGTLKDDMWSTYRKDTEISGDTWFRPLTTESVKIEPVVEETPVVKEDNNWGWMVVGSMTYAGSTDMGEAEAKAAAMRHSKDYQRTTLVFKVMGEYSTTCTTKWTPTDE